MDKIRAAIVNEAMTWLRTPWHHEACVKGHGVDCAQFIKEVYTAVGLIPAFETGQYPPDWHLHRGEQRFLAFVTQYARQVDDGQPGDIAMFSFGRADAHGSIVVRWPEIIHSYVAESGVVLSDCSKGRLARRFAGFYRLKEFA